MKTIVLGYDDSESAVRALGRVTQLAKAFDASVVAISAAPVLVPAAHGIGPIDPVDPPDAASRAARSREGRTRRAGDRGGVRRRHR